MTNITGVLLDPMFKPIPCASIRVTAVDSSGQILEGMEAVHKTNQCGEYDFELQEGRYFLEIMYDDEYIEIGYVVVDEFTPSPLNLEDLINYGTPVIPPISDELPTDWEDKFNEVIDGDEWDRVSEVQVRDGDIYSNEQKNIHKSGEQYIAREDFTQNATGSSHHNQYLTYRDDIGNYAATRIQEVMTPTLNGTSQLELFESSNGDEHLRKQEALSSSSGSYLESVDLTHTSFRASGSAVLEETQRTFLVEFNETYDDDLGVPHDVTQGLSSTSMITGVDLHEGEVYTSEGITFEIDKNQTSGILLQGIKLNYSRGGSPIETFESLEADPLNGAIKTVQADKSILRGRDGVRLIESDTEANTVEIFGKLIVGNPEDFQGEDGVTLSWTFSYSSDKGVSDPWHDEWVTGDIWRRDTQVELYSDGTSNPTGIIEYVKLTAEDGLDGDTYFLDTEYTVEDENGDPNESQWSGTYTNGDDWRRQREVIGGVPSSWWVPERIKGDDGEDGWIPEYEAYYGADGAANFDPNDPAGSGAWHKNLSNLDLYKYERTIWWHSYDAFLSTRNSEGGIDWSKVVEGTYTATDWFGATKIRGEDGASGEEGAAGKLGAGSAEMTVPFESNVPVPADGTFEVDVSRDYKAALQLEADPLDLIPVGAIITYISGREGSDANHYIPISYLCTEVGGLTWEVFTVTVDGNQVVHGTIAAESLVAHTITGDYISASSRLLVGGTPNGNSAVAGINGEDTGIYNTWRFWSGSSTPSAAEFRVNSAGKLWATDAEITGKVTASSGSIRGIVNVGTAASPRTGLNGTGANVDTTVRMWAGGADRNTAPFRVYDNGDIFAQSGTFEGTVYAKNIEGDVTDLLVKTTTTRVDFDASPEVSVLTFTIQPQPFPRTVVLSGLVSEAEHDDTNSYVRGVSVNFRLKEGSTLRDSATVPFNGYEDAFVSCRPLAISLAANGVARTFTLYLNTTASPTDITFTHNSQPALIQVFKNGSTIS